MKCSKICSGNLRHKVELQKYTLAPDGMGGQIETWTTYATVWGQIKPISGIEGMMGMQLQAEVSHDILLRYRDDVDASHRVKYGDRLFNIRAVIDVEERKRWLDLRCEEGVAQ